MAGTLRGDLVRAAFGVDRGTQKTNVSARERGKTLSSTSPRGGSTGFQQGMQLILCKDISSKWPQTPNANPAMLTRLLLRAAAALYRLAIFEDLLIVTLGGPVK